MGKREYLGQGIIQYTFQQKKKNADLIWQGKE